MEEKKTSPLFRVPKKVRHLLPSDPVQQLEIAKNIASMATASHISTLESQVSELRQKIAEKDQLVITLREKLETLENRAPKDIPKEMPKDISKMPAALTSCLPSSLEIDTANENEDKSMGVSSFVTTETEGVECQFEELEKKIGYKFNNKNLISEAVSCSSRLGFLGDVLLKWLMTKHIHYHYPNLDSQQFTHLRRANVCNEKLGRGMVKHRLYHFIEVSRRQLVTNAVKDFEEYEKDGSHDDSYESIKPPKVLASLLQCITGAVFIDSGESFPLVWKVIRPILEPLEELFDKAAGKKRKRPEPPFGEAAHGTTNLEHGMESNVQLIAPVVDQLPTNQGSQLEKKIGYTFKNKNLISETVNCSPRLEMLGDAVIDWLMIKHIYTHYPELEVGHFNALLSANVCNAKLGRAIVKYGLYHCINFENSSQDEAVKRTVKDLEKYEKDGSRDETILLPKVLANFMECIAGAVFIDSGESFPLVWKVIRPFLEPLEEPFPKAATIKGVKKVTYKRMSRIKKKVAGSMEIWEKMNGKKLLQLCQERKWPTPEYRCIQEKGLGNKKMSLYSVQIEGETEEIFGNFCYGRKPAKRSAAGALINLLEKR